MAINESLDLTEIPLSALKQSTLVTLSASLNQNKVIPANNGLPRDWRGFAQLIGLNGIETNQLSSKSDQFSALLDYWGTKGNISLLQTYLATIDRYDVLDDTKEAIARDSLEYKERLKKINTNSRVVKVDADKIILTVDDVIRLEQGLEPQIYDAYILYAEEDVEFATEIIDTMEKNYNFKFCVRDRDLIGGVQFEHDAITKLIAERCRRLVVIVSSSFLKSKANKFFVTFAQALGIDIRERKVIPILYERCDVPPELSYYFFLDYNRAGKLWNFWDKLRDSIQAPEMSKSPPNEHRIKPKNDLWISRTRFEGEEEDLELKETSEIWVQERKPKIGKLYKIMKSGFNKVKKIPGGQETGERVLQVASDLDDFSGVSGEDVPIENFDNSSGFESSTSEKDKSKKIKKKWYKKRAVEALLT